MVSIKCGLLVGLCVVAMATVPVLPAYTTTLSLPIDQDDHGRPMPSCPDKILNGSCIFAGGVVTALARVSDPGACCALCHGTYHDECTGWDWSGPITDGHTVPTEGFGAGVASHNCAIMAKNGPIVPANRISGIVAGAPPPPPPPPGHGPPCNTDLDCTPLTSPLWSCQAVHAPATPANNCHMHALQGNQTCGCTVQHCQSGPAVPVNKSATVQYLSIGDSISLGMQPDLERLVGAAGWELTHNPGNAANTNYGAHCLDGWLQTASRRYDIISFQFGLHDIAFDEERLSVGLYTALLTNITRKLAAVQKVSGTKLLWVRTTPVPTVPTYSPGCEADTCLNPPRFDRDVELYNAAADKVIAAANATGARISTADLYTFVLRKCGGRGYARCPGFQLPNNVHYTPAGWAALAGEMHRILMTAL